MAISPGTYLGRYEIIAPLGAGGWGEVWHAKDTRLQRDVALKVLPPALAENDHFVARFEREARVISRLSHPHICTLYDVAHEDSTRYLVMELLEGETLAKRIERGPLSLEDVLRLGGQIASALDRAHGQGIIHRDLKPANVMLTREGAKLVDFGVAHVSSTSSVIEPNSQEVTANAEMPLTAEGTIVGTVAYMAPEQLEGAEPDARTDIFALGLVLYEMVTRQRPFIGKSKASLIASIMTATARPITALAPMTPPALTHVIQRCLEKDPDDRWQSARDIAGQLRWISESETMTIEAVAPARKRRRRWLPAVAIAAVASFSAVVASVMWPKPEPERRVVISRLLAPSGTEFDFREMDSGSLAVSPDGRRVAFTARDQGSGRILWMQSLDSTEAKRLTGTEGARLPFWSPDGQRVGFFADGKLKVLDASGSTPIVICDAPSGRGGTWSREGVILFASQGTTPISRVSDQGGDPTEITQLDREAGESTHRWATFLPDGKHFLFFAGTHALGIQSPVNAIYAGSLDDPSQKKLILRARSNAVYASGHLLYARDNVLVAQRFDADRLELTGNPIPLPESVRYCIPYFRGVFSASQNGVLVYQPGVENPNSQLTWLDREGHVLAQIGREARFRGRPALSPDGKRAAATIEDGASGLRDIWLFDLERNSQSRFSFGPRSENTPVWSPDGKWVAWAEQDAEDPNTTHLMIRDSNGSSEPRRVTTAPSAFLLTAWMSDGRQVLLTRENESASWDLVSVDVLAEGPAEESVLVRDQFDAVALPSPDERWIIEYSDESGRVELWAKPLGAAGTKWQLTTTGPLMIGSAWCEDEIFYSEDGGSVYGLPVTIDGSTLKTGTPTLLFKEPLLTAWTMSADGKRFLATMSADRNTSAPLMIVQNWDVLVDKR